LNHRDGISQRGGDPEVDLAFETFQEAGACVLAVGGDVDLHTAPSLRDRIRGLIDDGVRALVIDMAGVEFLDSTGLGALLGSRKQMYDVDGTMTLAGLSEHVLKVFQITGLDQVFEIHPDRAAAVAAVENGATAGDPA
jgi:anti-sigma B factor antagonist